MSEAAESLASRVGMGLRATHSDESQMEGRGFSPAARLAR